MVHMSTGGSFSRYLNFVGSLCPSSSSCGRYGMTALRVRQAVAMIWVVHGPTGAIYVNPGMCAAHSCSSKLCPGAIESARVRAPGTAAPPPPPPPPHLPSVLRFRAPCDRTRTRGPGSVIALAETWKASGRRLKVRQERQLGRAPVFAAESPHARVWVCSNPVRRALRGAR